MSPPPPDYSPSHRHAAHPRSPSSCGFAHDERCRFRPIKGGGVRVVVRLTHHCNLACPHCLAGGAAHSEELDFEQWSRVLSELPQIDARKVLLTGGEPLLHPGLVDIVRLVSSMRIPVDLNSNLQTATKGLLVSLRAAGLTELSVAIDGPPATHDRLRGRAGAFARTVQAVQCAAELGINVDAACCVTENNLAELPSLLRIVENLPIRSFTVSRLLPIGHGASGRSSLTQGVLDMLHRQLVDQALLHSRVKIRLVGLLGPPSMSDCPRGDSLVGLTPAADLIACVLAAENPAAVPHPLEVGLAASLAAMRRALACGTYRLCWSSAPPPQTSVAHGGHGP